MTSFPPAKSDNRPWPYTLEKPAEDWIQVDFPDSSWSQGKAGFDSKDTKSSMGTPGDVVRSEWTTENIWLRKEFTIPSVPSNLLRLLVNFEENVTIYINGILAAELPVTTPGHDPKFVDRYEEVEISREALSALRPGRNILAVHCRQKTDGHYIAVRLVEK